MFGRSRLAHSPARYAEFLPEAEGLAESGHSPFAGMLILAVALVFGGLLGWSAMAEVEQVVRAEGTIEPAGRVKVINHPEGGRVAEIHVEEGQRVAAGDPLVTFDSSVVHAELEELVGDWQVRTAEAARLGAEIEGGAPDFPPELVELRPELVREESELLAERRRAHESRTEALARAVERRDGEVRSLAAELARLRDSHALLEEQVVAVRELAEKGLYPRLRMVELERELSDLSGEIRKTVERHGAAQAALDEARTRSEGFERDRRADLRGELARTRAARERLADQIIRHETLLNNLGIPAPTDGVVQDLLVTAPGQSVGSNQALMRLVPNDGGLVVEASVANEDIGSLRVGQPARIKVRAYDFLRYGALEGRIERIAADATRDQRTGALTYRIVVHADAAGLRREGDEPRVVAGMAVDVDLLTGERTILSYLTDRVFRLGDSAFREG